MNTFKITTKDEQWTLRENLSEKEVVLYWLDNYDNVGILDTAFICEQTDEQVSVSENGIDFHRNWF